MTPLPWRSPAAPSLVGHPQIPAFVAFARRIREGLASETPGPDPRLAHRIAGMSVEAADLLAAPLSLRAVQDLHAWATRDQTAIRAIGSDGRVKYVPFPYGRFKDRPNALRTDGATVREFAPPDRVEPELRRVLAIHATIPEEHPELRAGWLIHALLAVHPFADGNGRVARLLASRDPLIQGLPALWGESAERGPGWRDALDDAAAADDPSGPARVVARNVERQMPRWLSALLAPGREPPPTLAGLRDAHARGRRRAERWENASAALDGRLPALAAALREGASRAVGELAPWKPRIRPLSGASLARAAARHVPSGFPLVPEGALGVRLDLSARLPIQVRLGVIPLARAGAALALAWTNTRNIHTSSMSVVGDALFVVPEEELSAQIARTAAWVDERLPALLIDIVHLL